MHFSRPPIASDGDPLLAFVDESQVVGHRSGGYILCASLVRESQIEATRETLASLRMTGQVKLHWRDETARRRRTVTERLSRLDVDHLVVIRNAEMGERPERRRRLCLERLVFELVGREIDSVMLESRGPADDKRDRDMLDALRARKVIVGSLRMEHCPGAAEPLLWIPDSVAGMVNAARTGKPEYLGQLASRSSIDIIELRT